MKRALTGAHGRRLIQVMIATLGLLLLAPVLAQDAAGRINGFVSYLGLFRAKGLAVAVLVNRQGYEAKALASKALKAFEGE